jgi:hypothetical protein
MNPLLPVPLAMKKSKSIVVNTIFLPRLTPRMSGVFRSGCADVNGIYIDAFLCFQVFFMLFLVLYGAVHTHQSSSVAGLLECAKCHLWPMD